MLPDLPIQLQVSARHQKIFDTLDQFLRQRFSYKSLGTTFHVIADTMYARGKKYDLYIRFKEMYMNRPLTIVVARIYFDQRRKGHGTSLLRLLTAICIQHGYQSVEIESCNENAISFGKKLGFLPIPDVPGNIYIPWRLW